MNYRGVIQPGVRYGNIVKMHGVIEPGLLRIFRLFTALEAIFFWLFVNFVNQNDPLHTLYYINLFEALFLSAYLSWPWLHRKLKHFYLPFALVISTLIPITSNLFFLETHVSSYQASFTVRMWQFTPMSFVPLVLVAWQYSFWTVILYCLFAGVLDYTITMSMAERMGFQVFPILSMTIIRVASSMVVGYIVVQLMNTQREQRRALTQANLQLSQHANTLEQLATSRERNRLARELHDTLAHTLSGLAVQLEAVKTVLPPEPGEVQSMIDQSLNMTRTGLTETRRALKALRPAPLQDLGLELAIRNMAHVVSERTNLAVDVAILGGLDNLSAEVEQGLYRIVQEALENVSRHARARRVSIQLSCDEAKISLLVADDGEGFEAERLRQDEHFGIRGMEERAAMLGGVLTVDSAPGQGTRIHLLMEANHGESVNLR